VDSITDRLRRKDRRHYRVNSLSYCVQQGVIYVLQHDGGVHQADSISSL